MTFKHEAYHINHLVYEDLISFLYQGIHHLTQESVLIWEYKKEFLTPSLIEELRNTLSKIASLNYDGFLPVLETVVYNGAWFVISPAPKEWVTLDIFLQQKPSAGQLWQFSSRLLEGVKQLEQIGLVCGTLSPSYIWVNGDGNILLSRVSIPLVILKSRWNQLSALDDAIFYPPEFFQRGEYTIQSDVYAFGVLLYGLFGKDWPYPPTHVIEKHHTALLSPPQPFVKRFSAIPEKIKALATICLSSDPSMRFASFEDMIYTYSRQKIVPIPIKKYSPIEQELKKTIRKTRKKKQMGYFRLIAAIILVCLCLFGIQEVYRHITSPTKNQIVPQLEGLSLQQAQAVLLQNHLYGKVVGYRFHARFPEGIVIGVRPEAGREVKENRMVELFLSKGEGQKRAPNLVGKFLSQVSYFLPESVTLNIVKQLYSPLHPKGLILSQFPSPNVLLDPHQRIDVVISQGYPLDILVKPGPHPYIILSITASVLEHWDPYMLDIIYETPDNRIVLLHRMLNAAENFRQEYPVLPGGHLSIYIDQKLVFDQPSLRNHASP